MIEFKSRPNPLDPRLKDVKDYPIVILTRGSTGEYVIIAQDVFLADEVNLVAQHCDPFVPSPPTPEQEIAALKAMNEKLIAQLKSTGGLPPDYEAAAVADPAAVEVK